MADDPYNLLGGTSADEDEDDPFDLLGDYKPKPKRKARKAAQLPANADVRESAPAEALAPTDTEDDAEDVPAQPGPKPTPGRDERTPEAPSLGREIGRSAVSFAQGASLNWMDEILTAANYAADVAGLVPDATWKQHREKTKDQTAAIERAARDYPLAHGAGQAATGIATSLTVPAAGGLLLQGGLHGALQGAQSAASSVGDDMPWSTVAANAGIGAASGVAGGVLGSSAGKLFARTRSQHLEAELAELAAEGRRAGPQVSMPRPEAPLPQPPAVPSGRQTVRAYDLGELEAIGAPRAPQAPAPALAKAGMQEQVALERSAAGAPASAKGRVGDALLGAAQFLPIPGVPATARLARGGLQALRAAQAEARGAPPSQLIPNLGAARRVTGANELASELLPPGLTGDKANAQEGEFTAYADAPSLNYALSATLSAGNTGLPPEDEQALTSAVVRGDQQAINAADFRLRQRHPAYARRVERELRGLNEQE